MPVEQSPTSAFVRPRQEQQRTRLAEKVQTDSFYGAKHMVRPDSGTEGREKGKQEINNNDVMSKSSLKTTENAVSSGIPRRNFMKGADNDQISKQSREVQRRENVEKSSPKPRRKLPAAPTASSMRPRGPGNDSISRRSTPDHSRRSTPERQGYLEKSRATPENLHKTPENLRKVADSLRKTPETVKATQELPKQSFENSKIPQDAFGYKKENTRNTPDNTSKSQEPVTRKHSDSADKNSKIFKFREGSTTLPTKSSESSKSKGLLSSMKYNSLPRRHPPKNHSKFYLDIEGEECLQVKTEDNACKVEKDGKKDSNDKNNGDNGLGKMSSLTRNGKIFGSYGVKNSSNESSSALENSLHDLKQTHVALYKFIPRHKDEVMLEEGDPIHVVKVGDDLWFEGTNLASGKSGTFPSRYAADILAGGNLSAGMNAEDQQFFLRFLGSVEVADYKGDEILCYAISKIVNQRAMLSSATPPACTLQVSSRGIRVCDFDEKQQSLKSSPKAPKKNKGKDKEKLKDQRENQPTPTHFFSLKNVTFCGNHPRDRRYFGFITKHPDDHRFACHVFMSNYSTDPVAQAVGDCFKAFYSQYLDYRAPTEDIYME